MDAMILIPFIPGMIVLIIVGINMIRKADRANHHRVPMVQPPVDVGRDLSDARPRNATTLRGGIEGAYEDAPGA